MRNRLFWRVINRKSFGLHSVSSLDQAQSFSRIQFEHPICVCLAKLPAIRQNFQYWLRECKLAVRLYSFLHGLQTCKLITPCLNQKDSDYI